MPKSTTRIQNKRDSGLGFSSPLINVFFFEVTLKHFEQLKLDKREEIPVGLTSLHL
jgi:hypothetical protein